MNENLSRNNFAPAFLQKASILLKEVRGGLCRQMKSISSMTKIISLCCRYRERTHEISLRASEIFERGMRRMGGALNKYPRLTSEV